MKTSLTGFTQETRSFLRVLPKQRFGHKHVTVTVSRQLKKKQNNKVTKHLPENHSQPNFRNTVLSLNRSDPFSVMPYEFVLHFWTQSSNEKAKRIVQTLEYPCNSKAVEKNVSYWFLWKLHSLMIERESKHIVPVWMWDRHQPQRRQEDVVKIPKLRSNTSSSGSVWLLWPLISVLAFPLLDNIWLSV